MILEYLAKQFVRCIKMGYVTIEDIKREDLKQTVIKLLAKEGLGPDGKPLAKEPKKPLAKEPKKPVEDKKEDKASKDTKEEDKSPIEEDKGVK